MIGFLTPLADAGISYAYGFVFVGTNLAAALITWFFVYESVSLSLENVDLMYSTDGLKPWASSKWTPPGYINRKDRVAVTGDSSSAEHHEFPPKSEQSDFATAEARTEEIE